MKLRLAAAAALIAATPGLAAGFPDGKAAFDAQDFAAAERLWREEAAAGSPAAMQGLGFLYDLGLGRPRDAAAAFRWFVEAADAGLPSAAFNVGVMLDAGAGAPRAPAAAAVWYGRAAAAGNRRAQYNLGLLYAEGVGVARNPDLARHWLRSAAADLPAARDRLRGLAPTKAAERAMTAPYAVSADRAGAEVLIVWTAAPGPIGARFQVELLEAAPDRRGALRRLDAEGSALTVPLAPAESGHFIRVSRIDPRTQAYAASPWRPLGVDADRPAPRALAKIRIGGDDPDAARLARLIAPALEAGGLAVRIVRTASPPTTSGVGYAYPSDMALAEGIADFLPGLGSDNATRIDDADLAPGEIAIALRFVRSPEPASTAVAASDAHSAR